MKTRSLLFASRMICIGIVFFAFFGILSAQMDSSVANDARSWNDPQGWKDGTPPTINDQVYISPGATITLSGSDTVYCASIQIAPTGILNASSGAIGITGDWTNNGIFLPGTSAVILRGTTSQSIGGANLTSFVNLIDSNSTAPVIINRDVNVSGTLTVISSAIIQPVSTAGFNLTEAGQGAITGNGTVVVTKISNPATFSSQYSFGSYTLTNLTIQYDGTATQQISGLSYGNLTLSTTADNITASSNFNVSGIFTVGAGVVFVPSTTTIINSASPAGTITGNGMVLVSNVSTIAKDFDSQYRFTTYNLSNMEVNYTGNGMSLSNHEYGTLTINGTIIGDGTATVSKNFTVNDTFQPANGTMTFTDSASFVYYSDGEGIEFRDILVQTGATITTTTDFIIKGAITVKSDASFIASGGWASFYNNDGSDDIVNEGALSLNHVKIFGTDVSTTSNFTVNGNFVMFDENSLFYSFFPGVMTMNGTVIEGDNSDQGIIEITRLKLGNDVTANITVSLVDTLDLNGNTLTIDTAHVLFFPSGDGLTAGIVGTGDVFGYMERELEPDLEGEVLQFGNPNTTMTFSDFGTSEAIRFGVFPSAPAGDTDAVAREYSIQALPSGSGYLATLQFHYKDTELNGNDEERLVFERYNGSTYDIMGADSRDTINNFVTLDSVTQFSTWALMSPALPELTITGVTASGKEYDGNPDAVIDVSGATLVGVAGGDDVSLISTGATGAFTDKNAGTGKNVVTSGFTIAGADAGNYTLAQPILTADITQKALVGSITASDKIYDGSDDATISDRQLTGVISGDDVTFTGGSADFDSKNIGNNKPVTATGLVLGGVDKDNYTVNSIVFTTASIFPETLTVIGVTALDKEYDDAVTATAVFSGATLIGVVGVEDVSLDTVSATATFDDKNVGVDKIVSISGLALTGADIDNYVVTQPSTNADITAKPLAGSIVVASKMYDGTTSAVITARTLAGVIDGDDVTYTGGTASFQDSTPGTGKLVTATGLSLIGLDSGNYTVNDSASTTANIVTEAINIISGFWSVDSIWELGTVPLPSHPTRIVSGTTVTLDRNITCDTILTIQGVLRTGTDTVSGAGNFILSPNATLEMGLPEGISANGVTGNIQMSGSRSFDTLASYTFNGKSAQTIGDGFPSTVFSLTVADSSHLVVTNSIAVNGILRVGTAGPATFSPVEQAIISGNGLLTGYGTVNVTRLTSPADFNTQYTMGSKNLSNLTIEYSGEGEQTVNSFSSGNVTYKHLTLSGSGVKIFAPGTTLISGNLIHREPSIADAVTNETKIIFESGNQSVAAIDYFDIHLTGNGEKTFGSGVTGIAGELSTSENGIPVLNDSGTMKFNGNIPQAIPALEYNNLILSGTGIKIFSDVTAIRGSFIVVDSTDVDLVTEESEIHFNGNEDQTMPALSYYDLEVSGDGTKRFSGWITDIADMLTIPDSVNVDATTNKSTVRYNNGTSQEIALMKYYNLMLENGGDKIFQNGVTSIEGALTISGAPTPDFLTNQSTIEYAGDSAQTIPAAEYWNLELQGTGIKIFSSDTTTVAEQFTIGAGVSVDATSNASTIVFWGTANQFMPPFVYYNLIINKSNGAAYLTDSTFIANDLTIYNGIFSTFDDRLQKSSDEEPGYNLFINNDLILTDSSIFNANGSNVEIGGTWYNADDRFLPGASTVTFSRNERERQNAKVGSEARLKGTGLITFSNLVIADSIGAEINLIVDDSLILLEDLHLGFGTLTLGGGARTINPGTGAMYDVIGNVVRIQQTINTGIEYSFNNQFTTIRIDTGQVSSDISIEVEKGQSAFLEEDESILRQYAITANGAFSATMMLHYDDAELNNNVPALLSMWKKDGNSYLHMGRTGAVDTVNKSVSLSGVSSFSTWTLGNQPFVSHTHIWAGVSSDDWHTTDNWENNSPPDGDPTDIIMMPDSATIPFIAKLPAGDTVTAATFVMQPHGRLYGTDNTVLFITGNWEIDTGATVFAGSGDHYTIEGNFNNSGVFYARSSSIVVGSDWNNDGVFIPESQNMVTMNGANQVIRNGASRFNILLHDGTGTMNLDDTLFVEGDFTNVSGNVNSNNNNVRVTGKTTINADTLFLQNTVRLSGGLKLSGGTISCTGGFLYVGTVEIDSGLFQLVNCVAGIAGDWTLTGGEISEVNAVFYFDGDGTTQLLRSGGKKFSRLYHYGTDTLRLMDNVTVTHVFSNEDGVLETNGFSIVVEEPEDVSDKKIPVPGGIKGEGYGFLLWGGVIIGSSGSITTTDVALHEGELIAPSGQFNVSGNWTYYGGTFTPGGGTVTFTKSAGIQSLNSGGQNFNIVSHTGSGTLQLSGSDLNTYGHVFNSNGVFDANGFGVRTTGYVIISGGEYRAGTKEQVFGGGLAITNGRFIGDSGKVTIQNWLTVNDTMIAPLDTLSIYNYFVCNGLFLHNNGVVRFTGGNTHTISSGFAATEKMFDGIPGIVEKQVSRGGAIVSFNNLIIDDSTSSLLDFNIANTLTLHHNVQMNSSTLTMQDSARTLNPGAGAPYDVIGRVRREQADIATGKEYSFNNQFTTITFNSGAPTTDVVVDVDPGYDVVVGSRESILRRYEVTANGTFSSRLKLHYQDSELNGNTEDSLTLWRDTGINYEDKGRTVLNKVNNFVSLDSVDEFSYWTLANGAFAAASHIHTWAGMVSDDWHTAGNWVNNSPPDDDSTDVIVIPDSSTVSYIAKMPANNSIFTRKLIIENNGSLHGTANTDIRMLSSCEVYSGARLIAGAGDNYSIDSAFINSGTLFADSCSITIGGDWHNMGDVISGIGSVVVFNGAAQLLSHGSSSFANLEHRGTGALTVDDTLRITGNLLNVSGNIDLGDFGMSVGGNVTLRADTLIAANTMLSAAIMMMDGGVCRQDSGVLSVHHLIIEAGSFSGTAPVVHITGNFQHVGGTFNALSSHLLFEGAGSAHIVQSGGSTLHIVEHTGSDTLRLFDNLVVERYYRNTNGVFDANGFNVSLGENLLLEGGAYLTQNGNHVYAGNLEITNGEFVGATGNVSSNAALINGGTLTAPSGIFTVSSHWLNNATFNHNNGTIEFNGNSWQRVGGTSVTTFNNVTINGVGDSLQQDIVIEGTLNVIGGELQVGPHWVTLHQPVTGLTTNVHTDSSSSLMIAGTAGGITIPSSVTILKNFVVASTIGSSLSGNLIVTDSVGVFSGLLNDNGFTLEAHGNIHNTAIHAGSGKLLFSGGAQLHTIYSNDSAAFGNVEMNDAYGAVLNGSIRVDSSLTIHQGLFMTEIHYVTLGEKARLGESPGNVVYGRVSATRQLSGIFEDFGGIGFRIVPSAGSPAGEATVLRVNDLSLTNSGVKGVRRYFQVDPEQDHSLDSIIYQYDVSELQGLDPAVLHLFQRPLSDTLWVDGGEDTSYGNIVVQKSSGSFAGFWSAFPVVSMAPKIGFTGTLAFDTLVVGESDSISFPVWNEGDDTLFVYSLNSLAGELTLLSPFSSPIAPGDTALFNVRYDAAMEGETSSFIVFSHNDAQSGNSDSITVRLLAYQPKHPGDANNDGIVSVSDIIEIGLNYLTGGEQEPPVRSDGAHLLPFRDWITSNAARSDCNGNGMVDTGDVRLIADTLGATITNSGSMVYDVLASFAQSLPSGRFRDDLLAMIRSYQQGTAFLPNEWMLEQNYPNPFNGATVIRFGAPAQAQTLRLTIYDVLGREIKTFVQHDVPVGWHEVFWDGLDNRGVSVMTGVYFYRLETPVVGPMMKILYVR